FGTSPAVTAKKPSSEGNARIVSKPTIVPKKTEATNPAVNVSNKTNSNVRAMPARPGQAAPQVSKQEESILNPEQGDLISQLKERIEQVETEAQIKIAIAEFKTDILSDLMSDIKLLEHQIGGLLNRIHAKHPDLKQEALMIKKLLSDFSSKKRK
ncbi:MAG: hypothetical protein WDA09_02020, partial [Bacteriovoracaceae bacterium]